MKKEIKGWFTEFVCSEDETNFASQLDKKLTDLQENGNDFELVDIKLSANKGQYLALIIFKDYV